MCLPFASFNWLQAFWHGLPLILSSEVLEGGHGRKVGIPVEISIQDFDASFLLQLSTNLFFSSKDEQPF